MSATARYRVQARRGGLVLWLVGATLGWVGCSSDDEEPPPPPRENNAPSVDLTLPGTSLVAFAFGDPVTLRAVVDDEDNDPLTVDWHINPASESGFQVIGDSPPEAVWTAGSTVATDTVTVTVSDGEDSATDRLTFTIGTLVTSSVLGQTWVRARSPYLVREDLTVGSTRVLRIEEGVEVLFQGDIVSGALQKPAIVVQGRVEAVGTGSLRDERIFFLGGRDLTVTQNPDRRQHSGLRFEGNGNGLLERVTIEDGLKGIDHRSEGSLMVRNCRLEQNDEGYAGVVASHVEMEGTRVVNNFGFGINLNQASARLRACEVEGNRGAGLVIAAQESVAFADVLRCDLVNNGGRNVRIDNNGGFLTLIIHESNFGGDVLQVDFARCDENGPGDIACAPDCTHLELDDNFWGLSADEASQITDLTSGWATCMPEMAGWQPGADWSNQPFSLTGP